jgi:hypothetical protein
VTYITRNYESRPKSMLLGEELRRRLLEDCGIYVKEARYSMAKTFRHPGGCALGQVKT